MRVSKLLMTLTPLIAVLAGTGSESWALPFNQDMVGNQLANGTIQRPGPQDSVPLGATRRYVGEERAAALSLANPVVPSANSIANGGRLFRSQCTPCHGSVIDGEYIPGPVGKFVPGPNLFQAFYKDKPDAHFFQFIYFGGLAIMPAYGYKLAIDEHWDIVNYIRDVQSKFANVK